MNSQASGPAQLPWEGHAYSAKRHGVTISNCESEPITVPSCIQSHGALLVLRRDDLVIIQVSENTGEILGILPEQLLGEPVSRALGEEAQAFIERLFAKNGVDVNPRYVCSIAGHAPQAPLDATIHESDGLAIVELEPTGRTELDPQIEFYSIIKETMSRLAVDDESATFWNVVCSEIRQLTGLERIMIYQFHADGHGEIVAESRADHLASWVGLHYPAHDIPPQARDIFTKIWIRPIPNVQGGLAELMPLVNPQTGKPLDMTYCALRGTSLMYTEYLQNMGVAAAVTMPIRRDDSLWGLITGHNYSGPKLIGHHIRLAVEFLARLVSLENKAAERNVYRRHIDEIHLKLVAAATEQSRLLAIADGTPNLLDGIHATGAAIFHHDHWRCVGITPTEQQLNEFSQWLHSRPSFGTDAESHYVTDSLPREMPAASAFSDVGSGALAVSIAPDQRELIVWFRHEIVRTVRWGGNPYEQPSVEGPQGPRLSPRRSFEPFEELVRERSTPWKNSEVDAARQFRELLIEALAKNASKFTPPDDYLSLDDPPSSAASIAAITTTTTTEHIHEPSPSSTPQ